MSLVTFKNKGIINYGSGRSGKKTNQYFVVQGPASKQYPTTFYSGFSLNGGERQKTTYDVGFSKARTPYKGIYPRGNGGFKGQFYNKQHIMTSCSSSICGIQNQYVKPSSITNRETINKKYRWIKSGVYPNNIVAPSGLGNANINNTTQQIYIENKKSENLCDNEDVYDKIVNTECNIEPYTKEIKTQTQSEYIEKLKTPYVSNIRTRFLPIKSNGNRVC